MRRDLFHSFTYDIKVVFEAYVNAIKNPPFKKIPTAEEYSVISFKLGTSLVYNMNGGAVTIHLSKNGNGTNVQVRYSIVQLFGARVQAYDDLLYSKVVEELKKHPKIVVDSGTNSDRPNFCPNCGTKLDSNCNFCPNCGHKIS